MTEDIAENDTEFVRTIISICACYCCDENVLIAKV